MERGVRKDGFEVCRWSAPVQLSAWPRPRVVSFVLTIQEPVSDEGTGATGLTMGGCMGSGSQIPIKEVILEGMLQRMKTQDEARVEDQ